MNKDSVRGAIEQAIANLFANQPDIFDLSDESEQTEWNLTSHLAPEISALLPPMAYDFELRKPDAGDRRPDIVFHARGIHDDNFLVIEVKRDNPNGLAGEVTKIETYWFAQPYLYQFGAAINLNKDQSYQLEVLTNTANQKNAAEADLAS